MSDPILGKTLGGRYDVLSQGPEEMLGRIYLARDQETGALVSLKVLHPYLTGNPEKVRRFAREITATSAIRHPNTVAVISHGESEGNHWFVLEYLNSRTLFQELEQSSPLSITQSLQIAYQVAAALDAAHQKGVVHRNLNPGNLLLLNNARRDTYVKVADFGLSRLEGNEEGMGQGLTGTGARIGNTFYMAPEYIEDQRVDPRGDVYSLGGLLHHMLTGSPPFVGRPGQVLEMHITHRPKAPSRSIEGIPPWLDDLVLSMLDKSPERRPNAASVMKTLSKGHAGSPLAAPPLLRLDHNGHSVPLTLSEKLAEHKALLISGLVGLLGLGFVMLAGLAGALWWFSG